MMFVLIIGFVVVFGGMGGMVFWAIKKSNPQNIDTSLNPNASTAQDFLPFQEIKDGMCDLGANRYRAYLEVSSINYQLRTKSEREMIERSFHRFLNSLIFPTTLYIQTRTIDMSGMLDNMKEEIRDVVEQFPQLEGYGWRYHKEMSALTEHIGNNKQKKKFIIVSFDEATELEGLNEAEKYDYALKEMQTRLTLISDGLSGLGLEANILTTREVAELVYSTYHKENHTYVENIVSGEALTIMVEGSKDFEDEDLPEARLDWILYETQNRILNELNRPDLDEVMMKDVEDTLAMITKMREDVGGFYTERGYESNRKEISREVDFQRIDELKKKGVFSEDV